MTHVSRMMGMALRPESVVELAKFIRMGAWWGGKVPNPNAGSLGIRKCCGVVNMKLEVLLLLGGGSITAFSAKNLAAAGLTSKEGRTMVTKCWFDPD